MGKLKVQRLFIEISLVYEEGRDDPLGPEDMQLFIEESVHEGNFNVEAVKIEDYIAAGSGEVYSPSWCLPCKDCPERIKCLERGWTR